MRWAALFLLALFPFVGALLLAWIPRRTAAAGYRRARQSTAAAADAVDEERRKLEAADARLTASQRRLWGARKPR
jgi:hypothetical protein